MKWSNGGFTLIELLIVIATVGILAAVLIPNLLAARFRAFDTGAQTCLKEVAVIQEAIMTGSPLTYDPTVNPATIAACADVAITGSNVTDTFYWYEGSHTQSPRSYRVETGTSVTLIP